MLGGDWAGNDYSQSGCPSDCVGMSSASCIEKRKAADTIQSDYVNNNPSAFTNAYWDVASVRVFE